jgi:hypothetical protein
LTALRVPLTTGGDWCITPEGVPEASPLARVLRGREEREAGDTQTRPGLSLPALKPTFTDDCEHPQAPPYRQFLRELARQGLGGDIAGREAGKAPSGPRFPPASNLAATRHRSAGGGLPDVPLGSAGLPGAPWRLSAKADADKARTGALGGSKARVRSTIRGTSHDPRSRWRSGHGRRRRGSSSFNPCQPKDEDGEQQDSGTYVRRRSGTGVHPTGTTVPENSGQPFAPAHLHGP